MIRLARGPDHACAPIDGDLDRHGADSTRGAVEEHRVARPGADDGQRVDGSDTGEHEARGCVPPEIARLGDERDRRHHQTFRVRAVDPKRDRFVAHCDRAARSDRLRPNCAHDAGRLRAKVHRERRRAEAAGVTLHVDRVHAGGADVEHDFARTGIGFGFVDQVEHFGSADRRCHHVQSHGLVNPLGEARVPCGSEPAARARFSVARMAEYPREWESDVVLADGGTARMRPSRPDDEPALLALYERLSDDSIYLRFFSPVPRPTAVQLERLTSVDYVDHMVMVAQVGSDLVAVARYDRIEPAEAEVAFAVADDQQRRGLATLLLEHLAVIARANGIATFWADTLPGNSKMLRVFADAGWLAESHLEDGTVRVRFAIAPTVASVGVVEARERRAESASIARLLAPRSIAVIGAGRAPGKIGHELFRNLLRYGFEGPVYPVHPEAGSVAGVRAYPNVLEVPDAVDLAVVVVPAPDVLGVARQCAEKGVLGLIIISAGFAETGDDGKAAERELVSLARSNGMRIIGPNCLGVVNTAPAVRMNATFAPAQPVAGNVAFLSQSGGLGIELMSRAGDLGIGISQFVSVGNKADVSGNDLLQFWADDSQTEVVLLYLESFGNPTKFVRLARNLARSKPIVAVKSGRTTAGSRAASSHTAALASSDVAVDALFRQAG